MTIMDAVFGLIIGVAIAVVVGVWIYLVVSDFLGRD